MIDSDLTEEEAMLFALLMDESGVDHMEFLWADNTSDDGLFRTWPIQMAWWRTPGQKILSAGSRSIGKSLSILGRSFSFPFVASGEEMVITAPDGDRLGAITDKVETLFLNNVIAEAMLAPGTRGRIKHRPFHISFANGARIMGRIPRLDGTGIQGTHPLWLEHDEASTYPERGWKEIVETVKIQNPRARWRCHGVTMGPGNTFDDKVSGNDPTWIVKKLPAMYRPNWTEKERQDKIIEYGGYESLDYKRNILGTAEGADSSLLVLSRLMANTDIDELSEFNVSEYYSVSVTDALLAEADDILELVDPPISHTEYKKVWMGMDYGLTTSLSCILVFTEVQLPGEKFGRLKLVSRIMMSKIPTEQQVRVIKHLMSIYRPIAIAFDAHGVGQPAYEWLQKEVREDSSISWMLDRVKGYSFSENIVVDFDEKVDINTDIKEDWKRAVITRKTSDASLDILRLVVDTGRIWLPYDKELIGELQSIPRKELMTLDEYGKPRRKKGQHMLDAFRFALLAWKQQPIEEVVSKYENSWEPPSMIIMDYL
jgi:hypothetical protein